VLQRQPALRRGRAALPEPADAGAHARDPDGPVSAVLPRVARAAPLLSVVCGQGLASATSFATVLALGRWSGEAELGHYALGGSCGFLAMSLVDTLVATPATFFMAQKQRLCDD